jgi:hypothetical protein
MMHENMSVKHIYELRFVNLDCDLISYGTLKSGKCSPTFQKNVLIPSSGYKYPKNEGRKVLRYAHSVT